MAPLLLYSAGVFDMRLLREFEYKLYDMRLRFTAPEGVDPRVVIIDIDEKSLAHLGQWPWTRDILANLTDSLFNNYGVEVFGFDMVFPEPDNDLTLSRLKNAITPPDILAVPALEALVNQPSRDAQFAESLQKHNVVMGVAFGQRTDQNSTGLLPLPIFDAASGLLDKTRAPSTTRYTSNLEILQKGQPGGFFTLVNAVDSDGIIRKVPMLNKFDGALYPSLSLAIASLYLGIEASPIVADVADDGNYAGLEGLDMGFNTINVDQRSALYVPYRSEQASFRYVSAYDVISNNVSQPDDLAGVVALLGTSATGLVDIRATPVSNVFPGVEIHANLIASLLDGNFKHHPGWAKGVERILMLVTGLFLAFLLPSLRALPMTLVTVGVIAGHIGFNFYLWEKFNFVLSLAPILVLSAGISLINVVYGYLLESRSRLLLKRSFGFYVPHEIIEKMQGQSVENLLRSEKKEMTVLFTDVRGFTTISEKMEPEALSDLLNHFLTPMTEIVHRNKGAIDKYIGDAMMAFWGAPMDDPDHAANGVVAALAMVSSLDQLNREFKEKGWPRLEIGIGLNTGPMSVGNMGSDFRLSYTVLGDAVNLGARLEGLTKQYGVPILVGATTAKNCPDIEMSELDQVRVKGKLDAVKIFTPLGLKQQVGDQTLAQATQFHLGMNQYRDQNWGDAKTTMSELYETTEQLLYRVYLDRIKYFEDNPPSPDWDGVFDFQTK